MKRFYLFILLFILLTSCNTSGLKSDLTIIEDIAIPIAEPSGITSINNNLIIVSDRNGIIYTTDFKGNIIDEQTTTFRDLEGITIVDNNTIAVVDEEDRQLAIVYDNKIDKIKIKGENQNNNGLEGVAYNPSTKTFWIIQEKYPVKIIKVNVEGSVLEE
ncbi:MAG TPA: SdiA-regulated domain-containing protein, partial [Flavobacteriaceae bacterium]|nr:SdiA-regulated domain-containing protein [Flavobacteriaceae bacterium]